MDKKQDHRVQKMPIFTSRRLTVALRGMKIFLTTQNSAYIIIFVTLLVVGLGIGFGVSRTEWLWLIIGVALIWLAEMFNTVAEFVCDAITEKYHPFIKNAKDVGAAGVLSASIVLIIIALFIFVPYFREMNW